mgnify:CR=1 FL=1
MKKKYNVLIVDDEFLARKLLSEYVSKIDYLNLIDTCPNATKAMEVLKNENVDILLLDIQMPDVSGMEMLKMINNKPAVISGIEIKSICACPKNKIPCAKELSWASLQISAVI